MSRLAVTSVFQGDTVEMGFSIQTPDGAAQNLANATVRWGYSDPEAQSTRLLEKSSADGGVSIIDETGGLIQVNIDADELDQAGQFIQEVDVTFASGKTYTYAQGPFVIRPTVYPIEA